MIRIDRSPTSRGVGKKLNVIGIESEESTKQSDSVYVRCKRCGFLCNTDRDSKCPLCLIENYSKENHP
jgi:rubrerythrin